MQKLKYLTLLLIMLLSGGLFVSAQIVDGREVDKMTFGQISRGMKDILPADNDAEIRRMMARIKAEKLAKGKKLLAPSIADIIRYREFLKQPKTGITRLLKEINCRDKAVDKTSENFDDCAQYLLPGRGAFFSFRQKEYIHEAWADLGFEKNVLFSLGALNQGIMVELGDVEIETAGLNHEGLKFLVDFVPGKTVEDAGKQFTEFSKGVEVGKYTYKSFFPVKTNATYALRVVAYRGEVNLYKKTDRGNVKFNLLDGDDRKDILVVFRVLAVEPDGSITFVWKLLQSKESPQLKDNK